MREYKYRTLKHGPRKEGDDAVYQFILDHSTPVPKGFHIQFYIRNRKDFFTRVQARQYGLHRLAAVNEEWKEVYQKDKELITLQETFNTIKQSKLKNFIFSLIS